MPAIWCRFPADQYGGSRMRPIGKKGRLCSLEPRTTNSDRRFRGAPRIRDAAEWRPSRNTGWFAAQVVAVKQTYGLSANPAERDALASMLASNSSRTVTCD